MKIKGYIISGLFGLISGVLITLWATKALPKIVSRTMVKTMSGMMDKMQVFLKEQE